MMQDMSLNINLASNTRVGGASMEKLTQPKKTKL